MKWKHYAISAVIVAASALAVWIGKCASHGEFGGYSEVVLVVVALAGKAIHTYAQKEGVEDEQ